MAIFTPKKNTLKKLLVPTLTIILFCCCATVFAQGIKTGVVFNWADTQSNNSDSATMSHITINGIEYNTFVVPSSYELTRVGPGGHNENRIWLNGSRVIQGSNNPSWDTEALNAYQSLNLNHYFQATNTGDNFCGDYSAVATTDSQTQTIRYNPGIPSNPDGILAVTERAGNNCLYVEIFGIPAGGGTEQLLGNTFIRNGNYMGTSRPQAPPNTATSDYWASGRVNQNGETIGIGLFELSSIAPTGSTITAIKYVGATNDHGDGKFFLLQTYAVDDTFTTDFEQVFNGNVATNDNTPINSTYSAYTNPTNGSVTVNIDGTFTYTPNNDFVGVDTFNVEVCLPAPNQSVCNISEVSITVNASPIYASNYDEEITIICGDTIPEVPTLEFFGGCGNYDVQFSEVEQFSTTTEDYMIIRTWTVTDSCNTTETFEQTIFVMQPERISIDIAICITDSEIDLLSYLPDTYNTNGAFETTNGSPVLNGSYFDPLASGLGEHSITYSSIDTYCKFYADYTIIVNNDCEPCNEEDLTISKAVTPNGDMHNEYFTITTPEYCNLQFHVTLFNRWGKKIYESLDYQNDWSGISPEGSIGSSEKLPSGTYYYIINIPNSDSIEPINGYIYLGTK